MTPVRAPALALVVIIALASPVSAQERVTGEVRVGGGYDSNPALAADPSNRRQPNASVPMGRPPRPHLPAIATEDGVARIGGWIAGRLGTSPSLSARFDVDGRVYGRGDLLFWERLVLEGALRVGDVAPRCRLEGTRLDVTASDDSAWTGAAACGVTGTLPLGFSLAAELEGGVRAFDVGQLDGRFGGEASAGWAFDALAIELGLSVLWRESDDSAVRRIEVAPWLSVRVSTPYVGGRASYRYVAREFASDARSGGEHVGRAEVWGMPLPWLGAYGELELGYAEGGAQALAYERVQFTFGLRLALDWQPEPDEARDPSASALEDGWARFAFVLPDAERVSVVGDFNDWDETRGQLERAEGGLFEGRFQVGPGRHEYHLVVDGEPMRPPGALRYVRDDFGGENAVMVVGE